MIPKVIHYCWFGGKTKPQSVLDCIESWVKYLPDYEVREWNEENFDVWSCVYTAEAYKSKKWAFLSDYARFWILHNYGGVYFDTDVEVISDGIRSIIERGPFMGKEPDCEVGVHIPSPIGNIAPGLGIAFPKAFPLCSEILDVYNKKHLYTIDGKIMHTVVSVVTDILKKKSVEVFDDDVMKIEGVYIYPEDYFCPKNYLTGELQITQHTVSIHHYSASWVCSYPFFMDKIKKRLSFIRYRLFGECFRLLKLLHL